ncbi:TOMM precursor leader peptide-binding protein [Streptomyces sedi]|uniref:TOMM leader peptide-binding protein n=1 Tax=Streptomyces sedi TaxID=555059 RepID=A0A5C4VCK0_9ACTN|nr:TOMM precursor leader peptide-binding protein [Streptomyces sedi]TNM33627.1 TOMM precursor leader peptide-binding protein [Streptomyces sedi]
MPTDDSSRVEARGAEAPSYVLTPGASVTLETDFSVTVRLVTGDVTLRGKTAALAGRVLGLVARPHSAAQLAREVETPAATVERLLARLESKGLVTTLARLDAGPGADRRANAALSLFPDGGLQDPAPGGEPAEIFCLGDAELDARFAELTGASMDLRVSRQPTIGEAGSPAPRGAAPSLAVCLTREREDARLRRLDGWARRVQVPYLAGWFEGVTAVLTHVVIPGRNACYDCLCTRERAAAHGDGRPGPGDEESLGRRLASAPAGGLAAGDGLLASLASLRTVNVFAGRTNEAPAPTLLQLSLTTLKLTRHPVLRVPNCGSCGRAG